jgi:hypothetical protein
MKSPREFTILGIVVVELDRLASLTRSEAALFFADRHCRNILAFVRKP